MKKIILLTLILINSKSHAMNTIMGYDGKNEVNITDDHRMSVDQHFFAVVDQIDTTPLLVTSTTNIPGSASSPLKVVNSLAADVNKLRTVDDIGRFIGVYRDSSGTDLACIIPLGGGEIDCQFDSAEDVYLRAMEASAVTTGNIAINFLR